MSRAATTSFAFAVLLATVGVHCAQIAGLQDHTYDPDAGKPGTGPGPSLAGCPMFPATHEWNRDVSADPVDPDSATYIAAMHPEAPLHADWGSVTDAYGMPYVVVPGTQPLVPVTFTFDDQSDVGPYPIPNDAPIEGGDRHVIVLQQETCLLFEMYESTKSTTGPGWHATSGAKWNLRTGAARPAGWTSADSAGLPILLGLARPDELIDAREIKHALRFTVRNVRAAYVTPASHYTGTVTDPALPPLGLRVRLKASFDVSGFAPTTQVLLRALKKYGLLLADTGSNWFITGTSDQRWSPTVMEPVIEDFKRIFGSDFEVVKLAGPVTSRP